MENFVFCAMIFQFITPWVKIILSDKNLKCSLKEAALRKEAFRFPESILEIFTKNVVNFRLKAK